MSRIAYVNGRYVPRGMACVSIEDRGYQFADGVYDVCEVRGGRLVDEKLHMARLQRSLSELHIAMPMSLSALGVILRETIRRNRVRDGIVYVQITRGVARRDHAFPNPPVAPAIVVTANRLDPNRFTALAEEGVAVITLPDNRWGRADIKSISLLPNVLARQTAREQGAREVWLVDRDGFVTEGAASNAWIVTAGRHLVTRKADRSILQGVTRGVVLAAISAQGLVLEERPFTVAEAQAANEAFLTAASQLVMPVVKIDGKKVGNGRPGPLSRALREEFYRFAAFS